MKTKSLFAVIAFLSATSVFGQRDAIDLTFTAINSAGYVRLDSIKVMNHTQGGDTVLYWNDTVLSICYVTIPEISKSGNLFHVFQNYPNPVTTQTIISLYLPEKDKVVVTVTDVLGRVILKTDRILEGGMHSFRLVPGGGNLYFFTARWRGNSSSIKILREASGSDGVGSLEYIGNVVAFPQYKSTEANTNFTFNTGDELLYIGYANGFQSGILDTPAGDKTYAFQFAFNIPCPDKPKVTYQGQVYHTIQIFNQCWLKENLNVGTMINLGEDQTNNGIIEKYCIENSQDSCTKYGGHYQWDEMMQYTTQQGVKGICPSGWRVPTDEDWKILEGAVDSQYGIGDPEWDDISFRGSDAGTNLKTTSGWNGNGNGLDLFGFSGLPGGYSDTWGYLFWEVGAEGDWWTSTEVNSYAWNRLLRYDNTEIHRLNFMKIQSFSVRCLRK